MDACWWQTENLLTLVLFPSEWNFNRLTSRTRPSCLQRPCFPDHLSGWLPWTLIALNHHESSIKMWPKERGHPHQGQRGAQWGFADRFDFETVKSCLCIVTSLFCIKKRKSQGLRGWWEEGKGKGTGMKLLRNDMCVNVCVCGPLSALPEAYVYAYLTSNTLMFWEHFSRLSALLWSAWLWLSWWWDSDVWFCEFV